MERYAMQNTDYLRARLLEHLKRGGHIRGERIEEAFRTVPRHLFVPEVDLETAYSNEAVVTRRNKNGYPLSSSSMPEIVGVMVQQLDVQPGHRVLEVGAGTGYNAAILAVLASPDGQVVTVDIDQEIVQEARRNLKNAGYSNVHTVTGDGWSGVPAYAPFDRIEVTVGVWDISPHWVEQLNEEGIMVIPLWLRAGVQLSIAFRKRPDCLVSVDLKPCGFMRLRGPNAGPEAYVSVTDWTVSVDQPDPVHLETLRNLLLSSPRREAAPQIPSRWFIRLALGEPKTISLQGQQDWRRHAFGISLPEERSLAIISDGEIQTFGSNAARECLEHHLRRARALDLGNISIKAYPAGTRPNAETPLAILNRPGFIYVISEQR